ncbi:hypothetical protein ACVK1X_000788 [Pseudomonas sp. PvR086]|jgi:hypothetical protein|uniref:hypothetical protein n=1 Tax=Pseudomonas TaxID=286 RepID=UPI000375A6F5|nr:MULTISPECIES: hypothetical protein [Pseudomonas]MBD9605377.1 hypothetical protein [Pseudomonas sp. PDM08]MDR7106289.1 hypothetical protein [Pseudomonas frederiksbergensis]PMY54294.1 hypothetical protein C1X70_08515 [Pseudomonas sp. FW305-53]PMY85018.1 hypothetical protein C1X68_21310 [Pseudomonas sp. FW303-C2]PMY93370.1 hypothetical protein C1X67_07600 [Pseudomonas sp. FW305-62]
MALRQTYTVLVPFPTGGGHWSSVGQELDLLDVEASALRSAGRLELKKTEAVESASTSTPAKKAAAKKAE